MPLTEIRAARAPRSPRASDSPESLMRKKKNLKEFALVSLTKREIAKQRGKYITTEIESGRPIDLPKGYDNWRQGWSWQEICETLVDPKHTGKPIYELRESQTARVTNVVGSKQ